MNDEPVYRLNDYIYLPDHVADDDGIYCSRCGEQAIFNDLNRREASEVWIAVLTKHLTCERKP